MYIGEATLQWILRNWTAVDDVNTRISHRVNETGQRSLSVYLYINQAADGRPFNGYSLSCVCLIGTPKQSFELTLFSIPSVQLGTVT